MPPREQTETLHNIDEELATFARTADLRASRHRERAVAIRQQALEQVTKMIGTAGPGLEAAREKTWQAYEQQALEQDFLVRKFEARRDTAKRGQFLNDSDPALGEFSDLMERARKADRIVYQGREIMAPFFFGPAEYERFKALNKITGPATN